jgi:hypothetical protein
VGGVIAEVVGVADFGTDRDTVGGDRVADEALRLTPMALRGDGWTVTTPTMPPMNSAGITLQQR